MRSVMVDSRASRMKIHNKYEQKRKEENTNEAMRKTNKVVSSTDNAVRD